MTQNTTLVVDHGSVPELSLAATRYRQGENRGTIFRDLVLGSLSSIGSDKPTVLDVGCGRGLDGDPNLQESIARSARLIGVEPDTSRPAAPCFSQVYPCSLEDVPLPCGSVTVVYAVFVLEHLACPTRFWRKIYDLLVPGGVFWGLTV